MAFGQHPAVVDTDFYGSLKCKCGSDYLRQTNVTVFERREDAQQVTVIAQDGHNVQVSKFPNKDTCNPSPRRHGMIIEFDCESCSYDQRNTKDGEPPVVNYTPKLAIFQHKGNTFMEWID